ncbi:MAG: HRDC domain-containing protein [Acidobacteria bacterium]|nr:HRDC domain-containing protein [Acidobacteriota bacterium]
MTEAPLIADPAALATVVERLREASEYAVDTEFHRERSYYPTVALVQLAWREGADDVIVLVDPLAVDMHPLGAVLDGPGLAVLHAATQDLEVMQRACGTVPARLFDTQLAAGFLGFSTPSLASLGERVLGVSLPKASRLTDWLRRPLGEDQLVYAASDVAHLLQLADALRDELGSIGRLTWAEEECEELRVRGVGPVDPSEAWLRMKEGRSLRGRARGIAQEVAAWRERRAAELDQPVRHVLPDLAIVGIAGNPPPDLESLRRIRGIDERHTRGKTGEELLAAVARGKELPERNVRQPRREDVERDQRPAVALVTAWLSQVGRELKIDPMLLATRADLASFLGGDKQARLAQGWRWELLGEAIRRLVDGEFALAFDGRGGLALERRSGQPVTVDLPVPRAPWTSEGAA